MLVAAADIGAILFSGMCMNIIVLFCKQGITVRDYVEVSAKKIKFFNYVVCICIGLGSTSLYSNELSCTKAKSNIESLAPIRLCFFLQYFVPTSERSDMPSNDRLRFGLALHVSIFKLISLLPAYWTALGGQK